MRKLTLPILMGLILLPATAATAKEPVAAKVCGQSDCRTTKDKDTLMALFDGGGPASPPNHGVPWYSVRMAIDIGQDRPDQFDQAIVPSRGLLRVEDASGGFTWMTLSERGAAEYRRLTRGMAPFPASDLKGVGPVEAKVDEVVLPPEQEPAGGASPVPWIAGGVVVLLGLAAFLLRRRGLLWPKPAQG